MAAFAARRLRSCQYLTGPEEAGLKGDTSHRNGPRSLFRTRRATPISDIARSYPEQHKLLPSLRLAATPKGLSL